MAGSSPWASRSLTPTSFPGPNALDSNNKHRTILTQKWSSTSSLNKRFFWNSGHDLLRRKLLFSVSYQCKVSHYCYIKACVPQSHSGRVISDLVIVFLFMLLRLELLFSCTSEPLCRWNNLVNPLLINNAPLGKFYRWTLFIINHCVCWYSSRLCFMQAHSEKSRFKYFKYVCYQRFGNK